MLNQRRTPGFSKIANYANLCTLCRYSEILQYCTNYCAAHTLNQYIANYIIGGNSDHMNGGYHIFGGILDQDQHILKI